MTPADIALVKQSLGRLVSASSPLVDVFYMRLFAIAPDLRPLFPDDISAQNRKFVDMLVRAVDRLADPEDFDDLLAALGRRHRGYGAMRRHYRLVGEAFLWALDRELGGDYTPDLRKAWTAFYDRASDRMLAAA